MKSILLTLLFLIASQTAPFAQKVAVSGRVTDESGKELSFANIFILNDTILMAGTITDEEGNFSLECLTGNYQMKVSYLGYETYVDSVKFNKDVDLGVIQLLTASEQLEQVLVTEFRNELTAGIDKKVIPVTDELKRFNTNLSEILEMVPIVNMDIDGNPTIPGKAGVVVLVNGREPRMRADDLATVLKLIPSDQIVKIEIMTNPPAKYTKSNAAVINVVTNKKPQTGQMLNLHARGDDLGAVGGGGSFTMKRNRFSLSSWAGRWAWRSNSTSYYERTNLNNPEFYQFLEDTDAEYYGYGWYGGISPEYQINKKNTVSVYVGRYIWNNENDFDASISLQNIDKSLVSSYQRDDFSKSLGNGTYAGIEYFRTFDEKEKEFNVELGLDANTRGGRREGEVIGNEPFYQEIDEDEMGWSLDLEIEYFEPIDSTSNVNVELEVEKQLPFDQTLETRGGMNSQALSRVEALSYENTLEQLSQELSITYSKRMGVFGVNLDVGQEYIQLDYLFDQTGEVNREFFFVVPGARFTMNSEKAGEWGLSYKYGARAPRRWTMNPNIKVSSDRLTERFGNPDLDAERSHDVELNYGFYLGKFNIGASAFWRYSNNAISSFVRVNAEGVQQSTFANNGQFTRSGGALTVSGTVRKKLKISGYANVFDSRIRQENQPEQSTLGYELGANISVYLPKEFSINLSGNYSGPELMIQGEQQGFYQVRGNVRKSFWKGKVNASIFFNDLFRSIEQTTMTSGEAFDAFSEDIRRPAYVGMRLSMRFGELKDRPKSSKAMENNRG